MRTIHAESNALDLCGTLEGDHTLYTTVVPCRLCALRIIQAGIRRVVYHEYYISQGTQEVTDLFNRRDPSTLVWMEKFYGHGVSAALYQPRVVMERLDVPMGLVKATYT